MVLAVVKSCFCPLRNVGRVLVEHHPVALGQRLHEAVDTRRH